MTASADLTRRFQVPLIDPETPPSSTGGYPWRAAAGETTVVYLKNTTTTPERYLLQLSFPGGAWAPGLKVLQPGETLALDIAELRDMQVPDAFGRTIPADAVAGQVHWSIKSRTRHAIIGRAELVDDEPGVSASYACINGCPDNNYAYWSDSDPIDVLPGETVDVLLMLQDIDCYESILEPYAVGLWNNLSNWYVGNTGIATGDNNATITGISGGTTTLYADYDSAYWSRVPDAFGYHCDDDDYEIQFWPFVVVRIPTSLNVVVEGYVSPPTGVNYRFERIYEVKDQYGAVIEKSGLDVAESYSPNPPTGSCNIASLTTNSNTTDAQGRFGDVFSISSNAPVPCSSSSTQTITVKGFTVRTVLVTWQHNQIILQ